MYYAPHKLQKRVDTAPTNDQYGRPITETAEDSWVDVCACRCDHNGDKEVKLDDGTVIRPEYSVVCDGNTLDIKAGDYARCLRSDGTIRGEGNVVKPKTLNYLPYGQLYLQI